MSRPADLLIDWKAARSVGERVAGAGPAMTAVERARLREDFAEVVPQAEAIVQELTGLTPGMFRSRPWVMSRGEWVTTNLRGFERIVEPVARKLIGERSSEGALASVRRRTLGLQVGGLLGYVGHRVLGQYDLFLPPDDDGMLYFVGPNVVTVERRHSFPPRDFRMWLALHEVTHRLQFGGVPWLRGHVTGLVDSYLSTIDLDARRLLESLRGAVDEARRGAVEWRGFGWIFLLMTPAQRETFRQMQAVMTLLEGHGNYVMDAASRGRIPAAATFRRRMHERRQRRGVERTFQKAIGFDAKVQQYSQGERFVSKVVAEVGMDGFNRVWESADKLPNLDEVLRPELWVTRVGAG